MRAKERSTKSLPSTTNAHLPGVQVLLLNYLARPLYVSDVI